MPLEQLADGRDWRVCEALLDASCDRRRSLRGPVRRARPLRRSRGASIAPGAGSSWREPGPLARITSAFRSRASQDPHAADRTSVVLTLRLCAIVRVWSTRWHKLPARHRGADPRAEHAQLLLLPWPLRVRESDFRAVEGSVQRLAKEPFGFFEFAPEERLDLDLVDRMLVAARDEVGRVDVVLLPESAVEESDLDALEALLDRHGVIYLQAGVRKRSPRPGGLGSNQMHIGVNARLEKGGPVPSSPAGRVVSHSPGQTPSMVARREPDLPVPPWWRASPSHPLVGGDRRPAPVSPGRGSRRRHHDRVAGVRGPRAERRCGGGSSGRIGPTIVSTALLDGPQLTSRWSARYASVLADDPGSAVMTLTSYGMVQRSRPPGRDASPVIALWKDPAQGTREISLEPGAHGVLLTVCGLARPGEAPTAGGPSSTGRTTSTSPSTRSGPRTRARSHRVPGPGARLRV